jgi:hypothetical protein
MFRNVLINFNTARVTRSFKDRRIRKGSTAHPSESLVESLQYIEYLSTAIGLRVESL